MSNPAPQLLQKLWNYCNIGSLAPARSGVRPLAPQNPFCSPPGGSSLRDDGLSYGDYVEQLTFLLFLKMADEKASAPCLTEVQRRDAAATVPKEFAWPRLLARDGDELETHYRHVLESLGKQKGMLGIIFRKAQNKIDCRLK